ncbi:MAG: HigA family addiction module antidote protein [Deltaproteobacteria bacterium]|nr:HigA family addiction module antidote protein [Deltaproteobacteria bacterium]
MGVKGLLNNLAVGWVNEALGLTVTSAAGILGVRRATLSDVTNGKASVSAEMALRLEKAFGVSMDLLLNMQAGYDAAQARTHGDQIKVKRFRPANARL